jgi:hypothetical protein
VRGVVIFFQKYNYFKAQITPLKTKNTCFYVSPKKKTKVIFKLNTFLVCLDFKLMDLTQNERAKWLCLDV